MSDNSNKKTLSNRSFGLIFAAIFLVIGIFPWLVSYGQIRLWAAAIALLFAVTALVYPKLLAPLNKAWAKFGMLMHKITNPLLMGLVFFLTIFPTGLVMRCLKRDPMQRKLDPDADSYWIKRQPSSIDKEFFDQQF